MKKITRVIVWFITVEFIIMSVIQIYLNHTIDSNLSGGFLNSTIFWCGIFVLYNTKWAWSIMILLMSIVIILLQFPVTYIDIMGNISTFAAYSNINLRCFMTLFYLFVLVILLLDNPRKWKQTKQ